jgi:hypothetical protein
VESSEGGDVEKGTALYDRAPDFRRLRVFAVDPGMTARFETAVMNELTARIPWEPLEPGPVGEYVEVLDEDVHGRVLHDPVDLDSPELLAQHGLPPSDGSGQFRQQMAYAVAMITIHNFEQALGRPTHWSPRAQPGRKRPVYRPRLRLYPHRMREANAYYLDDDGSLYFGYFESREDDATAGMLVFTCLSQDVIAHELTHALLAGMNVGLDSGLEGSALGEAFADIVALFQHFGEGEVLRRQIAAVRGDLDRRSQLGAVAIQMGQAMGSPDGLRNALGATVDGEWRPRRPDPLAYRKATRKSGAGDDVVVPEPHALGDILVATVFEAFRKIYESRVADLRRIATGGTGELPKGELHPDLVERMAHEAAYSARHVLRMCIRALDYLPPVDVTFGDYLRAIVTADYDMFPIDERRYRIAVIDAFRSYGIVPPELGTVSADTLVWHAPLRGSPALDVISTFVHGLSRERGVSKGINYWTLPREREQRWRELERWRRELERRLRRDDARDPALKIARSAIEVRSLDVRERAGPDGSLALQWVVKIVERRGKAGSTLLVDADTGEVRYLIGTQAAVDGNLLERAGKVAAPTPTHRRLRVFAFDPSLGVSLETAGINEVTLEVPWERDADGGDLLEPGPVGEYLEVVDHDPASDCYYEPVDLDRPSIVAEDGLRPSEGDPQFHQQMAYAVAMRVIRDFERALGRVALWSPRFEIGRDESGKSRPNEQFVRRLRVHPHALREANAYYSPEKKALLFGYFPAPSTVGGGQLTVFTCLSHDIVAHEVTHALLDGIHRRFNEPSNPDVLAFHEAFADIVALFERFSLPEVLVHQIAATRGDLRSQNRLGELAQQFGQAIGRRGALRSAIGEIDPKTGQWRPIEPDPTAYQRVREPHDRGAILVAAVFDAFLTIYKVRVADLLRIATGGTGVLPAGSLHPDLVRRLADEAARAAREVLDMCIRALDYLPPVDVTFGDYLRAIVTADYEHDPVDDGHRRIAFAEAFRRYGIVPEGLRTLSVEELRWRSAVLAPEDDEDIVLAEVEGWAAHMGSWGLTRDRKELFELMRQLRRDLHVYMEHHMPGGPGSLRGIDRTRPFEVHSIRPSVSTELNGRSRFQWVIELTQRIPEYVDPGQRDGGADFYFRGGCTLLVDADTGKLRYNINKPLDDDRKQRQRAYLLDQGDESLKAIYFGGVRRESAEPFAALHRY